MDIFGLLLEKRKREREFPRCCEVQLEKDEENLYVYVERFSLEIRREILSRKIRKVFNRWRRREKYVHTHTHTLKLPRAREQRYPAIKAIEAIRIKNRGIYTVEVKGQS